MTLIRNVLQKSFQRRINLVKHLSTNSILNKNVKIGCASGFWGDTPTGASQLIYGGNVDYIMFDYLSEITMSLLTAAKAKNPEFGYAPDFVAYAIGPHLKEIKNRGIRILSNAGGINPHSCAEALRQASKKAGVDLKIAVVTGDNLMGMHDQMIGSKDLYSNDTLPQKVTSINAYLGSGPLVKGLQHGADIVITGRCADSSLALAPCIHEFGWKWDQFDLLSSGSLAGHLVECGAQVTGGICTDWRQSQGWDNIGFPIADVSENGDILVSKPPKTGGMVNIGTVSEQLLYETGDPRAYILPDVVCDFSQVKLTQEGESVKVTGALGKAPTDSYKVCSTYINGYKSTAVSIVGGPSSKEKCVKTAEAIIKRCRRLFKMFKLADFRNTHIQVLGSEDTYGPHARSEYSPREGCLWMSVEHEDKKALQIFAMEVASAGTGMAPGLTGIVGGRPKPSPILKLHSSLIGKNTLKEVIEVGDVTDSFTPCEDLFVSTDKYFYPDQPTSSVSTSLKRGNNSYRLEDLAYTRSGDKGNSSNVGVIARKASYLPYLQEALTSKAIADYFAHVFPNEMEAVSCVKRYEVPGIYALNFVLLNSLGGGGVASLRSDPQGKAYGQMVLDFKVDNMPDIKDL